MKLVIERNRLAHLGVLLSVSAALAEILQRFDFKPLAAYGFAVTMVCQSTVRSCVSRRSARREQPLPRKPRQRKRRREARTRRRRDDDDE